MSRPRTIRTITQDRTAMPTQEPAVRVGNFDEVALGYTEAQAVREAERCLDCADPMCVAGCPVAVDIPAFIRRIAAGDARGAHAVLTGANLLPAICGRVCPQEEQCELRCTVGETLDPVAIGRLERWVGDQAIAHGWPGARPPLLPNGARVAVVGSGPAGIACAADLAKAGCEVVVYEALHEPGGVLRYGIPGFRLPNPVIDAEVATLVTLGVRIECNTVVGRLFTIEQLLDDGGFGAVFVATGAGSPTFMGIPGESLNGVMSANELLTRCNLMGAAAGGHDTPSGLGRRVAVIGAGNTAMDALRVARRLGTAEVHAVYRRSRAEAPARTEELGHAEQEGIAFHWLTNPVEIVSDGEGGVRAMRCGRMELGEPDDSGRRRPVPIPGDEITIEVDTVVFAIGTNANPVIGRTAPVRLDRRGYLVTDRTLATSMAGVFAGGDIVSGAATVIEAMGAGRRAARAILADLGLASADPTVTPAGSTARAVGIATGEHNGTRLHLAPPGADPPRDPGSPRVPAVLARILDPGRLRHDDPLVLAAGAAGERRVVALGSLLDAAADRLGPAAGPEIPELARAMEEHLRRIAGASGPVLLTDAWASAAAILLAQVRPDRHDHARDRLDALAAVVRADAGERARLVGCGAGVAEAVVGHLWDGAAAARADRWMSLLRPLTRRLDELLAIDDLPYGPARGGRQTGDPLAAMVAGATGDAIDTAALHRLVAGRARRARLDASRRRMIEVALARLRRDARAGPDGSGAGPGLRFTSAVETLSALRDAVPELTSLVAAVRQGVSATSGDPGRAPRSDRLHAGLLSPQEWQLAPDALLTLHGRDLDAGELGALADLLASHAPVTILVTFADLVGEDPLGGGPALDRSAARLAGLAAAGSARLVQAPAAHLAAMAGDLDAAMRGAGPCLIVVHDGTRGPGPVGLEPYLASAAAAETGLFAGCCVDPDPPGGQPPLRLTTPTGAEPARHRIPFADADRQAGYVDVAFRPSDLLAADPRFAAGVGPDRAPTPAELDAADAPGLTWRAGGDGVVTVAETGEVLTAIDREVAAATRARLRLTRAPGSLGPPGSDTAEPPSAAPASPVEPGGEGDPAIDSDRCSSCGECVERYPALFAYDEDRRAHLRPGAGHRYAEVVAAAEMCQMAIIRPGLPADPAAPGMAALIERARVLNPRAGRPPSPAGAGPAKGAIR